MTFILIGIGALAGLGIVAALCSRGDDSPVVQASDGCAGCDGQKEGCQLAALMKEKNDKRACK